MIAVPTAAIVSTLADEYLVRDDIDRHQLRAA